METKHERPDWIKEYKKPIGTEIKFINGHWYLYERSSIWDSSKGKPKKKSGKLIGTITPQGLILKQDKQNLEELLCFEYGASQLFYIATQSLQNFLVEKLKENGNLLYVIILLKAKDNIPLNLLRPFYDTSYIKSNIGKLSFAPEVLNSFLNTLETYDLEGKYENTSFEETDIDIFKDTIIQDKKFALLTDSNIRILNYLTLIAKQMVKNYIEEHNLERSYEETIKILKTYFVIKHNRKFIKTKPTKTVEKICIKLNIPLELKQLPK